MEAALAWGRAIIISEEDTGDYITGKGLEIIPQQKVSIIRSGDRVPLILLYNGERVEGNLNINPENGRSFYMRTTRENPAMIKIRKSGNYRATARHNGTSCSLTFFVTGENK